MLDNFISHSSLPVQKIIWAQEGAMSANTGYGSLDIPISGSNTNAQSLLIDGLWTSDNWATAYPLQSNGRISAGQGGGVYQIKTEYLNAVITSNTQIQLQNYSDFGDAMKYRIWLYVMESDTTSEAIQYTSSILANSFQKTTSLAQLNLVDEIVQYIPNGTDWTYTHNLGFRPLVKIWVATAQNYQGQIYTTNYRLATKFSPLSTAQAPIAGSPTLIVDGTKIYIRADDNTFSPPLDSQFLIRIYNYAMPL